MIGVTAIDVEVPGDGRSVRGAYLDWMKTNQVMRPMHAEQQKLMADPFGGPPALKAGEDDSEVFGTVTAPLDGGDDPDRTDMQNGAAFEFGLEAHPLVALLTFEVASPQIEVPPEIYVNGEDLDPARFSCPIWPTQPIGDFPFLCCRRCNFNTRAGSGRKDRAGLDVEGRDE